MKKDPEKKPCPVGVCDGSGIYPIGGFRVDTPNGPLIDDVLDLECPHVQEEKKEEDANK